MLRGNHDVFCESDMHLRNLFILLLCCTVHRKNVLFCQFLGVGGCYACDLTTEIGVLLFDCALSVLIVGLFSGAGERKRH